MKIHTYVYANSKLRWHCISGPLRFDDLRNALSEEYQRADFKHNYNSLWDLRRTDLSRFSFDEIEKLADFVIQSLGKEAPPKTAIVALKNIDFGLLRMYEMQLENKGYTGEVRIFSELNNSLKWLIKNSDQY